MKKIIILLAALLGSYSFSALGSSDEKSVEKFAAAKALAMKSYKNYSYRDQDNKVINAFLKANPKKHVMWVAANATHTEAHELASEYVDDNDLVAEIMTPELIAIIAAIPVLGNFQPWTACRVSEKSVEKACILLQNSGVLDEPQVRQVLAAGRRGFTKANEIITGNVNIPVDWSILSTLKPVDPTPEEQEALQYLLGNQVLRKKDVKTIKNAYQVLKYTGLIPSLF